LNLAGEGSLSPTYQIATSFFEALAMTLRRKCRVQGAILGAAKCRGSFQYALSQPGRHRETAFSGMILVQDQYMQVAGRNRWSRKTSFFGEDPQITLIEKMKPAEPLAGHPLTVYEPKQKTYQTFKIVLWV
jgi:hypothetical protein